MRNTFENYNYERQLVLDGITVDREKVEASIVKQLRSNMKKMQQQPTQYFDLEHLLSIKEVKKHFNFFVITGDRNIGKTTSARKYVLENAVNKKQEFVWLRLYDTEIQRLLHQDSVNWFNEFGWRFISKNGMVYVPIDANTKGTSKVNIDYPVGHYLSLSTSNNIKSVDYKNVNTIIFDEFNTGKTFPFKFKKLTALITTIQRQRLDMNVLLFANYISQDDEVLTYLGLEQVKQKRMPLLVFNWIARSILWNIPQGHYQNRITKKTIGYRLGLVNYDTYKQEYGAEFNNKWNNNIVSFNKFGYKKYICHLFLFGNEWVLLRNDKKDTYLICNADKYPEYKDKVLYVFTKGDYLTFKGASILKIQTLRKWMELWKQEKIFTDEIYIADCMVRVFENIPKPHSESIIDLIQPH